MVNVMPAHHSAPSQSIHCHFHALQELILPRLSIHQRLFLPPFRAGSMQTSNTLPGVMVSLPIYISGQSTLVAKAVESNYKTAQTGYFSVKPSMIPVETDLFSVGIEVKAVENELKPVQNLLKSVGNFTFSRKKVKFSTEKGE